MQEASTLRALPFTKWARKFQGGAVRLKGQASAGDLGQDWSCGAGPIEVAFTFEGGEHPRMLALAVTGPVAYAERFGRELDADGESATLDGVAAVALRMDLLLERILAQVGDIELWGEVFPDGELLVKFQHGVQITISAEATVRIEGATRGPPGDLQLSRPLEVKVDGEGLRLSHRHFQWLSNLADIRIEGAALHPDGEVQLKGGAHSPLNRVVRRGLQRASARLSELVRRSPRFARVRSLLRES